VSSLFEGPRGASALRRLLGRSQLTAARIAVRARTSARPVIKAAGRLARWGRDTARAGLVRFGLGRPPRSSSPLAPPPPRRDRRLRTGWVLSALVAVLMAASAAAGLGIPHLYTDPGPVVALLRAYDMVTLLVATPILLWALRSARRGSERGQLAWLGMLAYVAYTYAIYVFGTAFNALFLVHVVVLSLTGIALILILSSLDVDRFAERARTRTLMRLVSGVLAFLGLGLGGMWGYYSLRTALTGSRPVESLLVLPPSGVHLAYALDLALLVPGYLAAAVLLWRRQSWGYLLAGVFVTAGILQQVGYLTALVFQARAGVPGATAFDPQEPFIAAAFLAAAVVLFAGLRPARQHAPARAMTV
jgi:hypothetical protein